MLPAADKLDNLDDVIGFQRPGVIGCFRDNVQIHLDGNVFALDLQMGKQFRKGAAIFNFGWFAVDSYEHSGLHKCKKPQKRLVGVDFLRFPTPALPGSGTKGRGDYSPLSVETPPAIFK
jgi:hypothetical protein